jgi:signal transduction histidine kinase
LDKIEKIKILYIDDEVNNLHGFKASFRFDYTIFIAVNVNEALAHLEQHPDIRVILSDQRMPDKTGVQFFGDIREKYPNPVRILITGYTDIESVIDAINLGNIYRYIKKPWTDTDIKTAIDQANQYYLTTSMLAIKNEELQKAYDELDKFAYSVTHDMRGPLLSILGAIDIARGIEDVADIREILGMMDKSVQKLDNFIQSIHDYYNLNRGQMKISDVKFDELVKDLQDIYNVTGKTNKTAFDVHVEQQENFRSDEMSLRIILNNLLSNAFKYQRKGVEDKFVKLDITVSNGKTCITVQDNGIGIDEANVNKIFNMFYRATSEEMGSGFGLYNVKDAIGKLGGEITVDTRVNDGSTFKVVIPNK